MSIGAAFTIRRVEFPICWTGTIDYLLMIGVCVHYIHHCEIYFAQSMSERRVLRVFVASPNDVPEERDTLAKLLTDINDVLAYLAPERPLSLELVRYETHSYPDIGAPQEVINREIPADYDIFVGIMWKHAGTPTSTAPSGTIEEFNRACERRKQGSLPRIMFYFCDEPIPLPTTTELQQLAEVVKFRSQLASQGLTVSYPSHSEFGNHVRGGLLRAIRDILREPVTSPAGAAVPTSVDAPGREAAVLLDRDKPWYEARLPILDGRVRARLDQLSDRLGEIDWLDGQFSAADILMVTVLRRLESSGILDDYPNLSAYINRGKARPAYKRAFEAQLAVFTAASARS